MPLTQVRNRAASLALGATIALTAFKLGVGYLSGSVGVLSEGIHSFLDLISAAVAFFSIRHAVKPADEDHPYGHGKIETLSSLLESLLLVVAACFIIHEGVQHLRDPHPVAYQGAAIVTIALSIIASYLVYKQNLKAAELTESRAIRVNALHFLSDVVASLGVLVGLIVLSVTGWLWIDGVMALGVALYIFWITYGQIREAVAELSDVQLPEAEVREIRRILEDFREEHRNETPDAHVIEAHDLRTRKGGTTRHIDFHLVVCGHMSVSASHAVCDQMEHRLQARFPDASVNIHVEPCEHENVTCAAGCVYYQREKRS